MCHSYPSIRTPLPARVYIVVGNRQICYPKKGKRQNASTSNAQHSCYAPAYITLFHLLQDQGNEMSIRAKKDRGM